MKEELEELRKELNARIDKIVGKDKLIVGKWYINKFGTIVNYQGRYNSYGFNCLGGWFFNDGWTFIEHPEDWSLCPIEKVEAALKKEADRIGYKEGMDIEVPSGEVHTFRDGGDSFIIGDSFCYNGTVVMKAGKWVNIIPKEEEEIFISNCKVGFTYGGVIINKIHLSKKFFQDVAYILDSKDRGVFVNLGLGNERLDLELVNKILNRLK